jgi:hypothetical protein
MPLPKTIYWTIIGHAEANHETCIVFARGESERVGKQGLCQTEYRKKSGLSLSCSKEVLGIAHTVGEIYPQPMAS